MLGAQTKLVAPSWRDRKHLTLSTGKGVSSDERLLTFATPVFFAFNPNSYNYICVDKKNHFYTSCLGFMKSSTQHMSLMCVRYRSRQQISRSILTTLRMLIDLKYTQTARNCVRERYTSSWTSPTRRLPWSSARFGLYGELPFSLCH